MCASELKIKMIESYLLLHRELNQLRLDYPSKKKSFTKSEESEFFKMVEQIKFNIKTREKILPEMTS
jgi:hypothetical protein